MQKDSPIYNSTITNLKALGIVLMVVGHSCCSVPYVVHYLYMFHMPLFFFASGYCFKRSYLREPFTFFKKRMGGAYLPFVKWCFVFLLLHNFFYDINVYNGEYGHNGTVSHRYDFHEALEHLINIVTIMTDNEQLLGGFWFLRSLFFGSIIAWIALKICKRSWISSVGILIICIVMNKFVYEVPLLKLHTREFAAALIIVIGHCFAYYKIPKFKIRFVVLSLILTFIGSQYWFMELGNFSYSNNVFPEYIITAVLATWSFYSIFERFKIPNGYVSSITKYIGNNTLVILTWHFLSFKIVSLAIILIYGLPIERLAEFPVIAEYAKQGWWIVYLLIGTFAPFAFILTKDKCLSSMIKRATNIL